MKKNYSTPYVEVLYTDKSDIITTSPGTETNIIDETDGYWW